MLAATYTGNGDVQIHDVAPVPPGPGEVQIRVAAVGLCGTDLHIVHGNMDARVQKPHTFGHEMSGTIEAVGGGVTDWLAGDAVTVMPLQWDGTCPACQSGHYHICHSLNVIGVDSPGALQQFWTVPQDTLVRLPAGLALDEGALVEPVAVAVHDVRRAELSPGDRALVVGGGPIGLLIATVARDAGADVRVLEPDGSRRDQIKRLGFEAADPSTFDTAAWVEEWTWGAGADVVFEVSGVASAVLDMTRLVKARGTVVIVAIHAQPREVDLHRIFWRELRIVGARVYQRPDFERAVELVALGVIPVQEVITRIAPMHGLKQALDDLTAGRAMKILIDVGLTNGDAS